MIWSHLMNKPLMENLIFCVVLVMNILDFLFNSSNKIEIYKIIEKIQLHISGSGFFNSFVVFLLTLQPYR